MTIITDPGYLAIIRKIMREPGFSFDNRGLEFAFRRWTEVTSQEERLAVERANFIHWVENLRAQDLLSGRPPVTAPPLAPRPRIVQGRVEPEREPEPVRSRSPESVPQLRFTSESQDWQAEEARPEITPPPRPAPVPAARDVARIPPRPPASRSSAVHVQQPSRKVAAFQQMPGGRLFPELAHVRPAAGGPKPLLEFTAQDVEFLLDYNQRQKRLRGTEQAGDEARAEGLERRLGAIRERMAVRAQLDRDVDAENERLARLGAAITEHGCEKANDLPADVLSACGFRKRVA